MMGSNPTSSEEWEFREVTPDDGKVLKRLFEGNPDGGDIQFSPRFKSDPYRVYSEVIPESEFAGYIAETENGKAVGASFIALSEARIGGELRPRGYLTGLVVDKEHRGKGLAKQLARKRIEYAEETAGDDVVISAAIQSGNEPSMAVARSWADDFPYNYVNHTVEVVDEEPETDYEVHSVSPSDVSEFVDGINEFYQEAELFVPYETETLSNMLQSAVADVNIHRCDVVAEGGEFVAGAHVVQYHKVMTAKLTDLPPELEEADELPPSLPEDREIRPSTVIPWFKPGYKSAASALINYQRANAGDANRLMCVFDPDGPLGQLEPLATDDGTIQLNWAVRGLDEPIEDTFVGPGLG